MVLKQKRCHFFHPITHRGRSVRFCVGLKVGLNFPPQIFPLMACKCWHPRRVLPVCVRWLPALSHGTAAPRFFSSLHPLSGFSRVCKENNSHRLQQEITIWLYEAPLPDELHTVVSARSAGRVSPQNRAAGWNGGSGMALVQWL